jgi:NADH-quinone oxidoreductase subunit G
VIDVCPVGALTNKVFRFKARPWELVAKESLGFHDALGSNLFHHVRRGEVLRSVPRDNEAVNECWLSDRDRYAHQGLYAEDRATVPLVRDGDAAVDDGWREATWDEALAEAAKILLEHKGDDLGLLVHPATSSEEGALLARLADALGTGNLDHRIGQLDLSDGVLAESFAMPAAELERAQAIVIVGSNLRHEVPLLHQRLRKAALRGARIHLLNPVDFDFAFDTASKTIVPPSRLASALGGLDLGDAANVAVIVGAVAENGVHAASIRKAVAAFAATRNAKVCRIPQGANALGLVRAGVVPHARDAQAMLRDPRKAYVVYGLEPGLDFADQHAALAALGAARVVAFSQYACQSTRRVADVILPIGALPEIEATLVNLDGREQRTVAAGKLRGEARPGWRVLRALGAMLEAPGFEFNDLPGLRAGMRPPASPAAAAVASSANQAWFQSDERQTLEAAHSATDDVAQAGQGASGANRGLELVVSQAIYRGDATVRRAAALQAHPLNVGPRATLHPADASASGIADGAMAKFATDVGTATLQVAVDARVAPGCAWVEAGHGATAPLASARVEVRPA